MIRLLYAALLARLWRRPDGVVIHLTASWPGSTLGWVVERGSELAQVELVRSAPDPRRAWALLDRVARELAVPPACAPIPHLDPARFGRDQ
jgi:hypothetical protein